MPANKNVELGGRDGFKFFKNTRYNTEDQLDDRNLRIWQLRDLVHVAGLTLLVTQPIRCHAFD